MDAAAFDVVIVGGGVQGLLILDRLIEAGYSCALVTEGDVGEGQTLHSHGFLNTGFGMGGDELSRAADEIVHPSLRNRGVELSNNWFIVPPPNFPVAADLPRSTLPTGFSRTFREAARKLPDRSFNKRQLVTALLQGREDRIIRGTVIGFRGREPVEAVRVQPDGSDTSLDLYVKAVVIAAGCGSKRLLLDLVGMTPHVQMIKQRVVHMVCLRVPGGALPVVSIAALPLGLMTAAHEDGETVTWYVTPMEMDGPSFDEVPNNAAAEAQPEVLVRASSALLALYPVLPQIDGLRVGHYAGYRQDIGDMPGHRICEVVEGTDNVIVALPSGLIGPWPNTAAALDLVRSVAAPTGSRQLVPYGGTEVHVGSPVEDRPAFEWTTWHDWQKSLLFHEDLPDKSRGGEVRQPHVDCRFTSGNTCSPKRGHRIRGFRPLPPVPRVRCCGVARLPERSRPYVSTF